MSIQQIKIGIKMLVVLVCSFTVVSIMATNLPAQKITLTFHYCGDQKSYAEPAVEKFNELHPEIKIVGEVFPWLGAFEMMVSRFIAKEEAPLLNLHCSWVQRFAELGWLANLDPYLHKIEMEDFWPDIVHMFNYKGKQYALPTFADAYGYVYNVDMYKEAGLDPDRPPQDWVELVEHLKKLNKPEKGQYGLVMYEKAGDHMGAAFVNAFIRQNKGSVLNRDYTKCTLNEESAIEGVRFVADLYLKHKVCAPASLEYYHSDASAAFAMGEAASIMNATVHAALVHEKNPDINIYSSPWPKGKRWKGPRMYGWSIGASARTPYKDEVWEFIEFLLSPEIVRDIIVTKGKVLGPRISVTKTHPTLSRQPYVGLIEAMEKGYTYLDPPIKEWTEIALTELDHFQEVFLGKATVEEALSRATKEINSILEER